MRLYFPVPASAGPEGVLLRSFLRECRLSTDLLRAVKFHGGGFEADGRPVLANQRVWPGQTVSFALPGEEGGCEPDPSIPVRVAYQDFFAAVLDKPAGLAVHPTLNYPGGTLANGYAALRRAEGRSPVFRPVNRIDKDTSGLVLTAQNAYAAPLLAQHVEKVYYAVAEGELPLGPGVIDAPIGRRGDSIIGRWPQPGGLRPGHRAHPPDPGPFRLHRLPPGRGRPVRRPPGPDRPAGPALRPPALLGAGRAACGRRLLVRDACAPGPRHGGKPSASRHHCVIFVKSR